MHTDTHANCQSSWAWSSKSIILAAKEAETGRLPGIVSAWDTESAQDQQHNETLFPKKGVGWG